MVENPVIYSGLRTGFLRRQPLAICLILAIALMFSVLVPPFQSPDEFDHVKRAYLFSKGQIVLSHPAGADAGGYIDSGLSVYFDRYKTIAFNGRRESISNRYAAEQLHWTGQSVFSAAPGAGYYFPLAYAPQAIGLWLGEHLDLTIDNSYKLARLLTLLSTVAVIAFAFSIFPVNALVLAILILPMMLFQFVAASLDAFTTAGAILCLSLFMRGISTGYSFPRWMIYLLAGVLFPLVTSRYHLLPLLALPLLLYQIHRQKILVILCCVISVATCIWLIVAIKSTYISHAGASMSSAQVMAYYLTRPDALATVLFNTWTDPARLNFYYKSFIGILGWLDTRFSDYFYGAVAVILVLLATLNTSPQDISRAKQARTGLVLLAMATIFVIFFSLLIVWNPIPVTTIDGVQGRYLTVPLMILAYALGGVEGIMGSKSKKTEIVLLTALAAMVIFSLPKLLIFRYFMVPYA